MANVVERVRKLLNVTAGSGASAQEVETAAKLAAELMREHKLAEADVTAASTDGSQIVDLPAGKDGFMATWRFALVTSVARAFFCEAIGLRVGRARKVRIVGRREDAQVVLEVANFLVSEIERLTKEYAERPEDDFFLEEILDGATRRQQVRAYRSGLAFGVSATLKDQAAKWRAQSEKALAVYRKSKEEVRAFMQGKFGASLHRKVSDPSMRLGAFEDGVARGMQIQIRPEASAPESSAIGGKGDSHDGYEQKPGER